jgi:hypothetical protein
MDDLLENDILQGEPVQKQPAEVSKQRADLEESKDQPKVDENDELAIDFRENANAEATDKNFSHSQPANQNISREK